MTAHTPGPWTILTTGGPVRVIAPLEKKRSGKQYQVVAHCGLTVRPEANARLIAAAPDYAAGVEIMLAHEDQGGDEWWRGWEMLKTAHAKAEGRP